jgi:phospholipase C
MTKILTATIVTLMMASLLLSNSSLALTSSTSTPIKHLVVIFQENVSYDHYFTTYPNAANPPGEPQFKTSENTPSANGLTQVLIDNNPNSKKPFRLDRTQPITCDENHDYKPEQQAYDGGLLDKFVETVSNVGPGCNPDGSTVMGYYDGNTVTALWNYAQHFAMSDNSFSSTFGPSTPGMLNLIAGETHGATPANIPDTIVDGTVIGDPDGAYDYCSGSTKINMTGTNIGDLLNAKGVTWGWFQGDFKPTTPWDGNPAHKAKCKSSHLNVGGANVTDYSAHHEPFEYYASTANRHHLPPTSVDMIGKTDQSNHQYDISNFWAATNSGNMPAVSFLKAAKYQDGHAGYSDPLDEQHFIVDTINKLQKLDEWKNTAVIILYDDSDGWYDHVMPPIPNQSNDLSQDVRCGTAKLGAYQDRCGYGPRQPLLVISPYAKENFVDHTVTNQASVLKFIEDNWNLGQLADPQSFDKKSGSLDNMFDFKHEGADKLFLDPNTGIRK